jgi:hypothetical protein
MIEPSHTCLDPPISEAVCFAIGRFTAELGDELERASNSSPFFSEKFPRFNLVCPDKALVKTKFTPTLTSSPIFALKGVLP